MSYRPELAFNDNLYPVRTVWRIEKEILSDESCELPESFNIKDKIDSDHKEINNKKKNDYIIQAYTTLNGLSYI